jgi:hypothetical protein
MRYLIPCFCLLAVLLLEGGASAAQARATPGLRDSARTLRAARAAQAEFERLRFRNLPWTWGGGSGGRCDERIGRFCLWHDEGAPEWKAPPEPEAVRRGRERLIARLDSAAARLPADAWVAGQRVRYLLEAGRKADAVVAAGECRAEGWWCRALEGRALHAAGEGAAADSAFEAALAAMPAKEREEWTDLAPLLPNGEWKAWKRLRAEMPERAERRLWWLADPLWSVPGNDRRAEHFARHVLDRLQDRARSTEGISWGNDLKEILLRYGAPIGWERIRPHHPLAQQVSVVTHYAPRSWRFLPPVNAVRDPARMEPEAWRLDDEAARAVYAPPYAAFHALEHQVARFRRGDSARVVAAYALDPDSTPAGAETEAALVLAADEGAEPRVVRATSTGTRGVLEMRASPGAVVMSLETRTTADTIRRVGRARYGLPLPAPAVGLALSDVLLLEGPAERPLPASLEEAAPRARGSTRVGPGEKLGLFWEVYGLPARTDTVAFSLRVARREVGWLRRAAERTFRGLAGGAAPVRVRWEEETAGEPVLARSLLLALPELPAGAYTLELSVAPRDGEPVVTTRALRVER